MKNKLLIKYFAAILYYYSGLIHLQTLLKGRKGIILGYHRVIPEKHSHLQFIQPGMYVTNKTFEMQLKYLRKYYRIIALEDIEKYSSDDNICIITFDDGWADNYEYAVPILKKYQVQATIFVTTNMIGTNTWPWPDRISFYIHNGSKEQIEKIYNIMAKEHNNTTFKEISRVKDKYCINELFISYIKKLEHHKIYNLMNEVDEEMNPLSEVLREQRPWLNWDEISEMARNNIAFGSHTCNHAILTNTSITNAKEEISKSIQALSEKTGKPVKLFSYPNGNYNQNILNILKEYGIKIAVTTDRGTIDKSNNLLTLKRLLIHNDITSNVPMFAYKLK
jgi:peptidoglycan/xylan/chitin deacetylase (PgdA/CDA1 family)